MTHESMPATILVVDDEASIHGVLTEFLQERGYRVCSAASADAAIELLQHARVAAIVLDVKMPGRSGLAVLEYVRFDAMMQDIPVLILTGAGFTAEEEALIGSLRAYVFYKQEDFSEFAQYIDRVTQQAL